ncbi:InlB B-repeat-containing protein [Bifidobacterium adolescentis]|uniref:InlB B-repeat-containing protein n=1 Tax=Bifidobacterium adolescentis TaxID=1680 RepID=UPI00189C3670|nr:InlB B-repeat-containing protein [Bifidobacterium adolescentis]MDB1503076.1 InlB B-repeat-containing protein [Bifidobacterium adolescentis]
MGFLTRLLAGLTAAAALGTGLAGTANAVDTNGAAGTTKSVVKLTADDTNNLPDHIVNGSFDYPSVPSWTGLTGSGSNKFNKGKRFATINPGTGKYGSGCAMSTTGRAIPNWNRSSFAWSSTQGDTHYSGGMSCEAGNVELNYDSVHHNQFAELTADQQGTAIYQDVKVTPGTMMKWSLKHSSATSAYVDRMQVMIGEPYKETAQEATRITSENGNKVGEKMTTISTPTTSDRADNKKWDTYSGAYLVPDGVTTVRFTFKSVASAEWYSGNDLDDIEFSRSYKLTYDKNSSDAAGSVPSNQRGKENTVQPAASKTDGNVKTVSDDAAGRTVLECKQSGEGATGPYADKFCWIDWSNLPLSRTGEPIPVRINVPGGHIDADATITHTDNAALTTKDFTGDKWSRLIPAYRLTGNTALAFHHIQGNSADPLASVMFSNITPVANQTAASVNVLKDFQLAFGDAETMSGYVVNDRKTYEQTDIESDKTLDKLGMIGDNNSYSEANIGYGTTHVTLAGGPAGKHAPFTDDSNSKGAAVIGATQPTRFKVSFKQVNHPVNNAWSAIAVGVYMPYLTAYPLTYDKNSSNATGEVPSNQRGRENIVQPAKAKTTGTVKTVADENVRYGSLANGDFSYPSFSDIQKNEQESPADLRTFLKSDDGTLWYNMSATDLSKYGKIGQIPGFDSSRFAWSSTENGSRVELQQDRNTKNTYAEIVAQQDNTSIYQNVSTGNGGVLYKIRLKHASRQSSHADRMQVLVGSDMDHATPVEMTRVTSNGHGDKVGGKSTIITTKVSNTDPRDHGNQWETYEGYYQVPEGQKNTVFMFKSLEGFKEDETLPGNNIGNLVDDIEFSRSYKLTYDKNSDDATGSVPSDTTANTVKQAKAKTSGTVKTVADDDLSKSLTVNPGFDVPDYSKLDDGGLHWMYVSPSEGKAWSYYDYINPSAPKHQVAGLSQATFGWQELTGGDHKTTSFELHREKDGNVCADVHGGRTIGQTIDTQAGVAYTVSIRHSGRSKGNAGSVQVLVGPDKDHLRPLEMSRMNVSRTGAKYGDRIGKVGTVVTTHSDSVDSTEGDHPAWDHSDDWETYSGTYVATGGKTVFAYRGVDKNGNADSVIDDLSFKLAYPLVYDKNAGDATGSVPSSQYGKENTVQPAKAKAKTTGTVRAVADRTASGLTVHDLKNGEIAPVQYGDFKFSTTDGVTADQITDVNGFTVKTNWNPTVENQAYGGRSLDTMYQPNRNGASLVLHHVGQWRDSSGTQRWLNAKITVNGQNLGSLVYYESQHKFLASYGKWDRHTSSRPYMDVTVDSLLDDGSTPQGLRGVTGFTDLDGGTSGYNEGVELVSGFDGAYVRSDAHLARFGTNGWAGITDENENNADAHGMKHYVGATFTGSSFRVRWSVASGQARGSGFQPVDSTIAYRLTYDKNAQDATGSIPSDTAANTTRPAKSETDGKVSDLVQRTTTHEDGSVTVKTIDTSTDVVSGCQVYYPAGQRITLATMAKDDDCWDSSMLSRPGHTQLGWNQDRNATQAQAQVTMVEGGMTVYAVWVGNPVLTYDTNKPSTWSGQMPSTPASVSVPYNTAAADGSGWRAGDTTKIRGYRFLGWYTGPQDNAGLYDWTRPLTGSMTVYAHWQRLQANVVYNANGGTGSHPNTTGWQYSDVTIPGDTSKSFKRDKYVFKGWGTKPGKADVVYKDGSKVALQDKDITLYAQWQEVHENFVETGGIGLPIAIAGGVLLLMFGIGSTVMLTRRMNGHGMPDDE